MEVTETAMVTAAEYLKKPYGQLVTREPDGTYRAEILEFPGCLATGETAAEALASLQDAAESWIDAAFAQGQRIPEPMEETDYSGKLVVRLPKSLHKRAAQAAERDRVSLNTFMACTHERGAQEFILVDGRCAFCLIEENERLRSVLEECADELETWVENYYRDSKEYLNEHRRYNRDIDVVLRARELLGKQNEL